MLRILKRLPVVNPQILLKLYDILSFIGARGHWFTLKLDRQTHVRFHLDKSRISRRNYRENRRNFKSRYLRHGFIESQPSMTDLYYGAMPVSYSGCEVIAIFNALQALDDMAPFPDLLLRFEQKGAALAGSIGTAPRELAAFLRQKGYSVLASSKERNFPRIAKAAPVLILTAYNDRYDITKMIHTICITSTPHGYQGHNCKITSPCSDILSLTRQIGGGHRGKGIYLIGILPK